MRDDASRTNDLGRVRQPSWGFKSPGGEMRGLFDILGHMGRRTLQNSAAMGHICPMAAYKDTGPARTRTTRSPGVVIPPSQAC